MLRDSDGDEVPDYLDVDSDDDRIPDAIEAGDTDPGTEPWDTDGDGVPDYLDIDSDDDNVNDEDEDRNGDGRLGDCETTCDPAVAGSCPLGQHCNTMRRVCVDDACLGAETDPLSEDTDGDGIPDSEEGTIVCTERSTSNPLGRRPVQYQIHTEAPVQLALEVDAAYQEVTFSAGAPHAMAWDLDAADRWTSGFAVSSLDGHASAVEASTQIIKTLKTLPGATLQVLASGNRIMSHDLHDSVVGTVVSASFPDAQDLSDVRNAIIAVLAGVAQSALVNAPPPMEQTATELILSFATQRRPEGTVVTGAVARRSDYDAGEQVAAHVDDAANGTALADPQAVTEDECRGQLDDPAVLDIVWIIDESGSMDTQQAKLVAAANAFESAATARGLSWRNCTVDMTLGSSACCTGSGQSDGTFVDGSDSQTFVTCIQSPNGSQPASGSTEHGLTQMFDTVTGLLPRSDNPAHIRPDAALVVIFLSDESAQELKDATPCPVGEAPLPPYDDCLVAPPVPDHCTDPFYDATCDTVVQPYLDLLYQQSAQAHGILVPAAETDCAEQGGRGRGYEDLIHGVGGQVASICQSDFAASLQIVTRDITAATSTLTLAHVPISSSLAVAVERTQQPGVSAFAPLPRSSVQGFDYHPGLNRLVFAGQPRDAPPYDVIVSYTRWVTADVPAD